MSKLFLPKKPPLFVPSSHAQTLLAKAAIEHFTTPAQFACLALAAKSIQNSSLGANVLSSMNLDGPRSISLFTTNSVFNPKDSFSTQLTFELFISAKEKSAESFIKMMKSTKYFKKSLRFLKNSGRESNVIEMFQPTEDDDPCSNKFTALISIDVAHCGVTDASLSLMLSSCDYGSRLESLNLRSSNVTAAGLSLIVPLFLQNLVELDLGGWATGEDVDLVPLSQLNPATFKKLILIGAVKIKGTGLQPILQNLSGMTHLDLSGCSFLTDVAFFGAPENDDHLPLLPYLKTLSLNRVLNITSKGIENICRIASNIEDLDLAVCTKLSDESVEEVASKLKRVRRLSLPFLIKLTKSGFKKND
jgi:hypothetical protein